MTTSARGIVDDLIGRGVHGIVLSWVDTVGINRIKTVPVAKLEAAAAEGVGMSPCFDTFLADDSSTVSEHLGGPDGEVRLVPDLDSVVVLAAQPGWAWAAVDRRTLDGDPYPTCSRSVLRRVVEESPNLEALAAIEIEFALGRAIESDDFVPACRGPAYSMTRLIEQSDFCADLLNVLAAQNIPVDQLHPEYSVGQYEVSVGALDPVAAADRSVLVRQTIRAVAQRHGLRVSFSPAVFAGGVGNGGHVHLSPWRGESNLLAGGDRRYGMTAEGEAFVAGILDALPALLAVAAPSPASYLRLQPSRWAGVFACWGYETREAAVRLVNGMIGTRDRSANVEIKCVDLAANPYALLAAILAAGAQGVAINAHLPPEITGDPARLVDTDQAVPRLPTTLGAAIDRFEASGPLRAALGAAVSEALVAVGRAEAARIAGWTDDEIADAYRWVF
ncbi:glutamine synthetase family protein [Antrihabitans sp. YC2-6]|uniref:glutamine synthetase family protein n=1 Tax=Antrihabitans sp. YC2-6 TaxID=2799498 RepID=UPI0018F71385|nr:glutamine synthetase family protein [Antrihabitans sp. YC2-6]MBJ8345741.1 glutamine synthetase [Antrihabitans sp. YC2-6]